MFVIVQGETSWKHQWRGVVGLWQNETGMLRVSFSRYLCVVLHKKKMGANRFPHDYKICLILKEILEEVVRELQKVKEEIIDGKFRRG